jgi:hemerythrin-like domain-containing protein
VVAVDKSVNTPIFLVIDESKPVLYRITHHKVKEDDTIYGIAEQYHSYDIDELASDIERINKLSDSELRRYQYIAVPLRKFKLSMDFKYYKANYLDDEWKIMWMFIIK